jgi:hypothetical protein
MTQAEFRIRVHLIRIRIQHFRLNTIRIRIQGFDDQNWEKFTVKKKKIFDQKLQFTYPYGS